ncbi:MAG: geranylgeranylglyceryl/heptaprenylglyceryl phosphate synthase [candidate division WOR-3 bacterium]|nr:geranylgeranylglyceryl/heptaprenylglyceryl phosphate synthase [candidate division WOR-3 bacterium]
MTDIKHLLNSIRNKGQKGYFVLLDPEKGDIDYQSILSHAEVNNIDGIMLGGSSRKIELFSEFARKIRQSTGIPVILFPGSIFQIADADAMLLLTFLNSRDPRYLIEEHLEAARDIYYSNMHVISTAYILIARSEDLSLVRETGVRPIEPSNIDEIRKYFYASSILHYDAVYLEGGSGTDLPVDTSIIEEARKLIRQIIIVGGGISDSFTAESIYRAGADIIVTGNAVEKRPQLIDDISRARNRFNNEIQN